MHNNFKIEYSYKALNRFDNFLTYMDITCRYRDTGLIDVEDMLIEDYINSNRRFLNDLQNVIETRVHSGVFGTIIESAGKIERTKLIVFLNSYNVTVYCTKKIDERIFVVDDIVIRT